MRKIQKGDTEAENKLLILYNAQIIHKVTYAIGRKNDDRKDLVNDIQIAIILSLRSGKYDLNKNTPLGSYIFGITMNKLRDYYKSRKIKSRIINDNNIDKYKSNIKQFDLENKELGKILRILLKKLKMKYKEVLYLKYFKQFSVQEISKKINLPPRKVSERLHYALKLLRKECKRKNIFSIFQCLLLISI